LLGRTGETFGYLLSAKTTPYAFATTGEAERYGRLAMEALEARYRTWLGRSAVRSLSAGTRIQVRGLPNPGEHRYSVSTVS